MKPPPDFWNSVYGEPGYAYGTAPNDFLASVADRLTGPILEVASGEGRNVVWLAEQGHEVHGVDASRVGVDKTLALAAERGVTVHAQVGDLATYTLGTARWGAIVGIFAHLPPPIRHRLHAAIADALVPGGLAVFEFYTPRQLAHGTGGPPVVEMLYEPDDLRRELVGLTLERLVELERPVIEGRKHTGTASVVQVLGRKD